MSGHERELAALALQTPWFRDALHAVRALGLDSWCIGAGAVRNLVWDALHGHAAASELADIDVAWFDAVDCSAARDRQLQALLAAQMPQPTWDVTNQAGVHHWYAAHAGAGPVAPYASLGDAVASWPEFATSVGIWLTPDGHCRILAPHGLDDLFGMVIRRNPARVSQAVYEQRLEQKRYRARWPNVTIIAP